MVVVTLYLLNFLQPVKMMQDFLRLAQENTKRNLETCGVLAGSLVRVHCLSESNSNIDPILHIFINLTVEKQEFSNHHTYYTEAGVDF